MRNIFKRVKISSPEIRQAVNRREMITEKRLNHFRTVFVLYTVISNLLVANNQGIMLFMMSFGLIAFFLIGGIYYFTAQNKYYSWLKYAAVFFDFTMTFGFMWLSINYFFDNIRGQIIISYLSFNISVLLFFNLLSLLRSKRDIVLFSGFMALLVNTVLFSLFAYEPAVLVFYSVLIIVFTIFNLWAARQILTAFIANKKLEAANRKISQHNEEILAQRDEIQAQKEQIEDYSDNITNSIRYARRIQRAALPDIEILSKYFLDYFIFYRPKDIVSGDFYWMKEKNGRLFVAAADCTGHGVPGAYLSILSISLLNEIANRADITAAEVLEELRGSIKTSLRQEQKNPFETQDGLDISLIIKNRDSHEIQYAGAYNSLCLTRKGKLSEIKATRCPVGPYPKEKSFENHVIPIQGGDRLFLFSDGFQDQSGGPKNAKFKSRPFKQLLAKTSELPPKAQKLNLEQNFDNWKAGHEQIDDVLIIGLQV
jgi:serine phosphatase RsbU (regulator of sigma subunit)